MSTRTKEVITIRDAAKRLGLFHHTVTDLVRTLGIEPKPIPYSPRGKGLDAADIRRIRRAAGLDRKHTVSA